MQTGDIISYLDMCQREGVNLQRGMNFKLKNGLSVILMSRRKDAPYEDQLTQGGSTIIYEGHDVPRTQDVVNPKALDQQETTESGRLTQNGLFHQAAQSHKNRGTAAELVRVYEKIKNGIWVYNGVFKLTDSWLESKQGRKVFKFKLELADEAETSESVDVKLRHDRLIPSEVKLEVWKRDAGKCVECGATDNLHFDHILPFSKGGTSITAKNIQLLCARHNLRKGARIDY